MVFADLFFIYFFLPLCLIFYFTAKTIGRKNTVLIIFSLIFYAWGEPLYVLLLLFSAVFNWFVGLLIGRFRESGGAKIALAFGIVVDLGLLLVFKYSGFLVENFNALFGAHAKVPQIALPIGISFFTFQALSYIIDCAWEKVQVQRSFKKFLLYLSLFPQLIAGPIVRYSVVEHEIDDRQTTVSDACDGALRVVVGLAKKVIIANNLYTIVSTFFGTDISGLSVLGTWYTVIIYSLYVYFDFSGYSDIAIGLGRIFGFQFKENFNYPYISQSIREFWRRWHISLSTWFKEYVYIPLGGNRRGTGRTYLNLFIVFLLTGIWHGANFTFLAWGIYYGILLVLERLFLGKLLDKNPLKFLNHIYVIFAVIIGWVFFRADNIYLAFSYIKGMFTFGKAGWSILSHLSGKLILCLILGVLFCGPMQEKLKGWYEKACRTARVQKVDFALQMILVVLSILALIGGTYNPFIYFQF